MTTSARAESAIADVDRLIDAVAAREHTGTWTATAAGELWAFGALGDADDLLREHHRTEAAVQRECRRIEKLWAPAPVANVFTP